MLQTNQKRSYSFEKSSYVKGVSAEDMLSNNANTTTAVLTDIKSHNQMLHSQNKKVGAITVNVSAAAKAQDDIAKIFLVYVSMQSVENGLQKCVFLVGEPTVLYMD